MDTLGGYIATITVSLIVGYLGRYLEPKSKLIWWSPHNFLFHLTTHSLYLQTNSITIQNVGRRAATDVTIIHKEKPDYFEFYPAVQFSEESNSTTKEHILRISSLGPKEWVFLQLLSYQNTPVLQNIRWKDGQAKAVSIRPQRIFPRALIMSLNIVCLVGAGTVLYWLIRLAIAIGRILRLW